jgi:hypothetical protein
MAGVGPEPAIHRLLTRVKEIALALRGRGRPAAELWAVRFRTKIFVLGASIAWLGGYALASGARHHLFGVRAIATFITYTDECAVEFLHPGEGRSGKTMSCDAAEHLQRALGSREVEFTRVPSVQFRFTLASGEVLESVRSRTALGNPNMDSGDRFTVVYDPADPDDVRIIPSVGQILLCFGGIPAGLSMMLMALGIHPASALRWLGRASRAVRAQTLPVSAPRTRFPDVPPSPPQKPRTATTRLSAPRNGFGKG